MAKEKWYVYPGPGVEERERGRATIHAEFGLRFDPGVPVLLPTEIGEAIAAVQRNDAGDVVSGGLIRECEPDEIKTAQHVAEQKRLHGDGWQERAEAKAAEASAARGKTTGEGAPPRNNSDAPAADKATDKPKGSK